MKKSLLSIAFFAATFISFSQTSIETLKKDLAKSKTENQKLRDENTYLRQKLDLCNALSTDTLAQVKKFSSVFDIQVASCRGDRTAQTVTIDVVIQHSSTNKRLAIDLSRSNVVDGQGQALAIGNRGSYEFHNVYTNTPLRIPIVIKNVLPGTESLSIVALLMGADEISNTTALSFSFTELRNIKIIW